MKDILIALIVVAFLFTWAWAWQPIYPAAGDYNMNNINYNFNNIQAYKKTINAGASSATFTDVACDANSYVVATINTNVANYIQSVVPTEGQIVIYLNGAAAATVEVSVIVITK
jgi:hypothetical protein